MLPVEIFTRFGDKEMYDRHISGDTNNYVSDSPNLCEQCKHCIPADRIFSLFGPKLAIKYSKCAISNIFTYENGHVKLTLESDDHLYCQYINKDSLCIKYEEGTPVFNRMNTIIIKIVRLFRKILGKKGIWPRIEIN